MTWLQDILAAGILFRWRKLDWEKKYNVSVEKTNDCQVWVLLYYQTYLTVRPANETEGAIMFMACADVAIYIIQQKMLMKPPILMNVSIMHPRVQLNFQEVTMIMIKNHDDRIYQDSIPGWFSSNEDFLLPPIDAIIQDFRSYRYVWYTWCWLVIVLFFVYHMYLLLLSNSKHEHQMDLSMIAWQTFVFDVVCLLVWVQDLPNISTFWVIA